MAASPTVLRRRLGRELRNLREAKSLTAAQVAKGLSWSESKVSRIEGGKSPLSDKDAKLLLNTYGVEDSREVAQFVDLVRRSRQNGWWHSYGDALPEWFKPYLGFEADASQILIYETELVHGLLQTERYAQAVIRSMSQAPSADEVDRRASARLQRQEILTRDPAPKVWVILNESVIHRRVGTVDVMREQLHRLAEMAESLPNVTVQVLPFEAGAHASMGYSFSILSFEDTPGSLVYSEQLTSAVYLDKTQDVGRHEEIFQQLVAASTRPDSSVAWLKETAERFGK
ncbi:helix-turn-helix transcriptional regulator [Streptomyces sp. NPDC006631]|uniref:helix-turn-helix domain-containing protein n=1 Tax=Streptomyces sp. NPDC006631 TaxID=3364752 RepID=UPI0036A43B95